MPGGASFGSVCSTARSRRSASGAPMTSLSVWSSGQHHLPHHPHLRCRVHGNLGEERRRPRRAPARPTGGSVDARDRRARGWCRTDSSAWSVPTAHSSGRAAAGARGRVPGRRAVPDAAGSRQNRQRSGGRRGRGASVVAECAHRTVTGGDRAESHCGVNAAGCDRRDEAHQSVSIIGASRPLHVRGRHAPCPVRSSAHCLAARQDRPLPDS